MKKYSLIKIIVLLLLAKTSQAQQLKGASYGLHPEYVHVVEYNNSNTNHIRLWLLTLDETGHQQLFPDSCMAGDIDRKCTDTHIDRNINAVNEITSYLTTLDMVIDLHSFYRIPDKTAVLDEAWRKEIRYTWQRYTAAFKDNEKVIALDILNEPPLYANAAQLKAYNDLMNIIIKDMRILGFKKPIIIEVPGNQKVSSLKRFKPTNFSKNVWYSMHPYDFLEGQELNSRIFKSKMDQIVNWQKKYAVPMYIGEFGVFNCHPKSEFYWKAMRRWLSKTGYGYASWNNNYFNEGSNIGQLWKP